jgi:hypothetical protein
MNKEFDEDKAAQGYHRMESATTVNIEAEKETSSGDEGEALDNPDLYFGEKARDKFWDFYKSERSFKDYTKTNDEI